MKVVIADDNTIMADGIASLIRTLFPELTVDGIFYNGVSLNNYLDEQIPGLLITDIRMPKFSGLEACKKIRSVSSSAQIILLTGYAEFEYAKQAISYRVHEFITKPYDNDVLIAAITSALNAYIVPLVNSYISALKTVTVRDFLVRHADEVSALTHSQLLFLLQEAQKEFPVVQSIDGLIKSTPEETLLYYSESCHDANPQTRLVKQAKLYIRERYANPVLSLTMIADDLTVSSAYLSNIFKRESGVGLNDYIAKVRIEHAKNLLKENTLTVFQIAEQTGFGSHKYFTQVFKERVGMTPTQYQRVKANEEN